MTSLPIDPLVPEIVSRLQRGRSLVIEAPPGAGKTTRVPPALLALAAGDVLVLEPRRIAARMAARRVAFELGEAPGETAGYQVRFEEVAGPRTRLRFLTEGVLTRRLLSDPRLEGVATVVLDEFHERHLEGDLALALLARLQRTARPDLRLVVMSATLEAAPVAGYLGGCEVMRSPGRQHPLQIEYTAHSAEPLERQVLAALERLAAFDPGGHALVFLPGAAEIRRAMNACAGFARRRGFLLLALHGDQPPEEQDRAVAPSTQRKIIISTNVSESSVTIDGVAAVIDSGLARVASTSPWSGLPVLAVARISQASANQRAGRAGRTGPGRAIRLYPLEDFVRRPAQDAPEIARADLAPVALQLRAMHLDGFGDLAWLDAPPEAAVVQAGGLLHALGALAPSGRLTPEGREMARHALHPRLARLVLEAGRRGAGEEGCRAAAVLSAGERLPAEFDHPTRSDLLVLMEREWQPHTARILRQIRREAAPRPGRGNEDALLMAVLAAFPDRVARRRQGAELLLAEGGSAVLSPSSTVRECELMVAVEVEDRRDQRLPMVRIASGIEPEWLLDLFPERVREKREAQWNRAAERVEGVSALTFGAIAITESRGAPDLEEAAALLASKALEAGIARFTDEVEVNAYLARVGFAARYGGFEPLASGAVRAAVEELAQGRRGFAELRDACARGGLLRALERQLPPGAARLVEELAPARIRLPGGRHAPVHYPEGEQPPWIASRLQDFFGMRETPRVAGGKVAVVVHLLAPNQRPVQMTADLAGFWQRLYPQVRRELSRRYPRHAWPDDPL